MTRAHWGCGGAPVAGAALGLLVLETDFCRPPGDAANAVTWDFPVLIRVVRSVAAEQELLERPESALGPFTQAAQALVADGAAGIAVCCGFLSPLQRALSWAAGVPVLTSALQQVPLVESMLPPGERAGILTISAESLSARHLEAALCAADTPVEGLPPMGALRSAIFAGATLDKAAVEAEMIEAAERLLARTPEVGALVLECTNMPPYARALSRATGLPVYSIFTALRWFQASLRPPVWPDD